MTFIEAEAKLAVNLKCVPSCGGCVTFCCSVSMVVAARDSPTTTTQSDRRTKEKYWSAVRCDQNIIPNPAPDGLSYLIIVTFCRDKKYDGVKTTSPWDVTRAQRTSGPTPMRVPPYRR